jgi:hypothetical protein
MAYRGPAQSRGKRGIPLHELAGFLAATIGATKQSGANIGNMIKSVTLSLSNPAMQKELRQGFGFEVTGGRSGDQRDVANPGGIIH